MLFALLDVSGGLILLLNLQALPAYIGYAMLIKGLWTFLTSFQHDFLFMLIGIVDIVAGGCLLMSSYGTVSPFFTIPALAVLIKGVWSLIFSL